MAEGGSTKAWARLKARAGLWRRDGSDRGIAQRMAGATFVLRVVNAAIALISQVLLARIMGEHEFGIYAYAWTWVLLLGYVVGLGIPSAAQRFIPEYTARGEHDLLRGFLRHSRSLAFAAATLSALLGAAIVYASGDFFETWYHAPLYLALACLPLFALVEVQDGIARSYNWIYIAITPTYLVRPLMILAIVLVLWLVGYPQSATLLMAISLIAVSVTAIGQLFALDRRLAGEIPRGTRRTSVPAWLNVSLPLFLIEGFYLLLTYADVLILERFHPPGDVAIYFAATKVMALASFVSFAVANATAHRFAEYNTAGDRAALSAFVRDAVRWTFWPSLVMVAGLLVFGKLLLWLFGPQFTAGYHLLPILAVGLLARAVVGPVERLLAMCGEQRVTAWVYFCAFVLNVALNFALIPHLGLAGAAAATSTALSLEAVALFFVAKHRMGIHVLPWGGPSAPARAVAPVEGLRVEELDLAQAQDHRHAWTELASASVAPNVFYSPAFASAAFRNLPRGTQTRLLFVWHGERLVGLWPVRRDDRRFLLPLKLALVEPAYAPLTTPLLAPGSEDRAAGALVAWLRGSDADVLIIPRIADADAAAGALEAAFRAAGVLPVRINAHDRAFLDAQSPFPGDTLNRKKTRELERQRRRLAEHGALALETHGGTGAAAALERFLDLEASGWKGARGTALKARSAETAFVREAITGIAGEDAARVMLLTLDGAPIAGALILLSGSRAYYFKTAYDEAWSRFSPGLMLTDEITRALHADPAIHDADSVADANHPMIDHVWRERIAIADWVVPLDPGRAVAAKGIAVAERLRGALRARLRRLLRRASRR